MFQPNLFLLLVHPQTSNTVRHGTCTDGE